MSAPVLVGFAGVLVAAVATGMLAGQCVRRPRTPLIAWTAATLGLTIALVAQSMGFVSGFDPVTFRSVQLAALLLVPLALAWGLIELTVRNDAARFGGRLIGAAVAVVTSVILAIDPLSGQPFGRTWPLTAVHFQLIARSALAAGQGLAVLAALACVSLVLAGRGLRPPLAAAVPPGLAVLMMAGLRFPIPARTAYPLLSTAAAVLVWFGARRIGEMPGRGERDERLDGVHDGGGRYRPDDDFWPGDPYRPAEGSPPPGQYAPYGQRPGRPPAPAPAPAPAQPPAPAAAARPYGRIQIFTLLDDRAAEFDRLAEEAAELVSAGEPDTLVYVIHLVPNAPLQRIFYEIHRDRAAFDAHESQPYMQRFVAGRRSLVLATNVIELRLKYAKVAPLPSPQPAGPQLAGPSAGPPSAGPPPRPPVPAGPPRSQPRPPVRPQPPRPEPPRPEPERYDRQGYDQERYQQERYEQERYEQRRPGPRPDQRPDQRPGPDPRSGPDPRPDPRPDQRPDPRPGPDPRQVPSAGRPYGGG
jgi:quinol monooxygenase YgiN